MKSKTTIITFAVLFIFQVALAYKSKSSKPNIILICVDDLECMDLGCYGSEIKTPNLDRLGEEGIRFRQMHSEAKCVPSRFSLLTGVYSQQKTLMK